MTVRLNKTEARQAVRRSDQEQVFRWSLIGGAAVIGLLTLAVIAMTAG